MKQTHSNAQQEHRRSKKYADMHKSRIRITYNSMGEKCANVIGLDGTGTPRRGSQKYSVFELDADETEDIVQRTEKDGSILAQTHPFHLKRVTKILREILESKIQQDLCHKNTCTSFMDILQFYSNTWYGMTSVATMRRLDLFYAIRALSPHSHFISVMGRMMNVPETVAYQKDIVDLYSTMWSSLLKDDLVVQVKPQHQSYETIQTSMVQFLEILKASLLKFGIRSSPKILATVEQRLQSAVIDVQDGIQHMVDVDDAFFCILTLLEEYDYEAKQWESKLFEASIVPLRVLSAMARDIGVNSNVSLDAVAEHGDIVNDTLKALSQLKLLLNALIIEDDQRQGLLPKDLFCKLIKKWYRCSFAGIIDDRGSGVEIEIASLFLTNGTVVETVDYMEFFCLLHSFILEYSCIPTLKRTMELMIIPHRGVELSHYDCAMNYLHTVRLTESTASWNHLAEECGLGHQ